MDHKRRALREEFRQLALAYLQPFEDWLTERGIAFCYVIQPYTSWAGDSVLSIAGRAGERLPLEIVHNKDRLVELAAELNQRLGLSSEEIGRMTGPAEDQTAADSESWDQLRGLLSANERRLARAEAGAREQAGAGNFAYVVEPLVREHYRLSLKAVGDDQTAPLEIIRGTKAQAEKQAERYNRERLKLSPEDVARITGSSRFAGHLRPSKSR
jgi:hypothetical protein